MPDLTAGAETSKASPVSSLAGRPYGLLAQFESPASLYRACQGVRDAGYRRWDAHSPFPVHGLSKAMGLRPSRLPWVVFLAAMLGCGAALLLQWWIHAVDYPLVISGKPFFSWPAFVPVVFEITILLGALGAVLGLLHMTKLPRHHHPLFRSSAFERVTDDAFFISIEAADPRFEEQATEALLRELGALDIERVRE